MQRDKLVRAPVLLGKNRLFGVSVAPSERSRTGVIVLNAGMLPNMGPYRMFVDLSDRLAHLGFAVVRLDQSGKGESPLRREVGHTQAILLDYDDAFEYLQSHGVERTILVGLCSGAADAMQIAHARSTNSGLVLTDGFAERTLEVKLRHYSQKLFTLTPYRNRLRALFRAETEESTSEDRQFVEYFLESWEDGESMRNCYKDLLARGSHILSVFTDSWSWYYNKEGQLARYLDGAMNLDLLQELHMPESNHTFTSSQQRQRLIDAVCDWTIEHFSD